MSRPVAKSAATQREWEDLAELDPLWAILSNEEKQFRRWDVVEFFASGQREVDDLMEVCGFKRGSNGRVLDFGCGVGRLSRGLRTYFGEVYGVDISKEMIRLAREHTPSCNFLLNQADNLHLFQDDFFDFVYSNIVLQHQRTRDLAKAYIREFVRVTRPQGTIVFQIPYKLSLRQALQPRRRLYSLLRRFGFSTTDLYNRLHLNPMRTICLTPARVEETVSSAGARLVRSYPDDFNVHSMSYVVTKD
ncbi:MAG TPA: class I SAM-dependent methyltransferase [Candidatus Acidoferrales bacterium]|nr:class I SAM-dependent methyltransferase [Candidatus Acidoferrales bacterium]